MEKPNIYFPRMLQKITAAGCLVSWYRKKNGITVRCSNYTDEWWKPVVFFFGVKPCLFLKWTFFLFFSWWMQPIKRSFYNPATWAIKQLPSKQTQESGTTSIFHTKKYALKKHTSQTSQTHNIFFWEAFYHGIHRISPQKKTPQRKTTLVATIFIFDPTKTQANHFFPQIFPPKKPHQIHQKEGVDLQHKKYPRKLNRDFFLFKRIISKQTKYFLQENLTRFFFFQGVATRWAPTSYR